MHRNGDEGRKFMNKKLLSLMLLVLCLCTVTFAASAQAIQSWNDVQEETTERRVFDEIVVGTATRPTGHFFTDLWGNNTTDMDVRTLLHGYSPVYLFEQTTYEVNGRVAQIVHVGDYSDGNSVYVVTLEPGLQYSDGTSIRAADYAFSLLLQMHPALGALGADTSAFHYIVGYDAYNAGETDVLAGVRLINDITFSVEIKSEYLPYFYELGMLDIHPYPIDVLAPGFEVVDTGGGVSLRAVDGNGQLTADLLRETIMDPVSGYMTHPTVSSGPYTITGYDPETGIARFEINPYYAGNYQGALPTIARLVLRPVTPDNIATLFASGEVQLLNKVANGRNITEIMAEMDASLSRATNYTRLGLGFLSFNDQSGPFTSEAVRKAIAYAVDTDAFIAAFSPYAIPVYGYMGMGQWMYQLVSQEDAPIFAEDEADIKAWEALSLDTLNRYDFDLNTARALLDADGWTLNDQGEPYAEGKDAVRYKRTDGQLHALTLRWGVSQGSVAAETLAASLPQNLAALGIGLEIVETSFDAILADYYTPQSRQFDMLLLATNFGSTFDPSFSFGGDMTGLHSATLEGKALALRATEPGDLLAYAQRWVDFQEAWNDTLPLLPLYSNVYFDFYVAELQNYLPNRESGWADAIVCAYVTEEPPQWLQGKQAQEAVTEGIQAIF